MNDKITSIKIAITLFFGALSDLLGWKGVMVVLLAGMMALDYISGTLAAKKSGTWSSKIAREGLFHKGGTILVVLVALILDVLFVVAFPQIPFIGGLVNNPGIFLPLVCAWYIITEMGSILENAVLMGAPTPSWFRKAIAATGKLIDKTGDAYSQATGEDNHDNL